MRDDLEEIGDLEFDSPADNEEELTLSYGVVLVNNRDYRQNGVFDAVKVIEDIEPPVELNRALEFLLRTVKTGGSFKISKELWGRAAAQPTLSGKFARNEYHEDDTFIIFVF